MKQYTKTYLTPADGAKWISPARDALAVFDRPKEENFPDAKFIWPYGSVRFHAFRLFTPEKKVRRAEMAFRCDNLFDVWLNGENIVTDTRHLELTDVTRFLRDGENNLHIRGYQSSSYDWFSAALTGGIRLIYEDGTSEDFPTDSSYKQVGLVNFWETKEPEGFETETNGRSVSDLKVTDMHPVALRRSFCFIRRFEVKKDILSVKLRATALGCYEPYMNGARVSDARFEPFCMNYVKEYQEYDITPLVKRGTNVIGAVLGNGSYNCHSWGNLGAKVPEYMASVDISYADGTCKRIVTDESWRCLPSPLTENDIQYGERYDARLEVDDWCLDSLDLSLTSPVSARDAGGEEFLLQSYPPVKRMKDHVLTKYRLLSDGSPIYDTGVSIAGRAEATFRNLRPGQKVRLRYCERLRDDGEPENGAYVCVYYQNDCGKGGRSEGFMRNADVYTAKGAPEERYECRFAYTGFRYIWVEELDSPEQIKSLTAFELYNDLRLTGEIDTPDGDISRIFTATRRSWLNNISNGPTDCPTREKNYWNGDSQLFSHTACWYTDNSGLLSRWTDNGIKTHDGPYAWEDETYEMPYTLYRFYGDTEILRARYPKMLELVKKRQEFSGMILPVKGISHQYNDWLSPGGVTPDTEFFGGCWYIHMLDRVSEIASILGDSENSERLHEMADISRAAFNEKHLTPDKNDYDAGNQCGIVLPLAFGIAPEDRRQSLADTLSEYVRKAGYHTTTGFIGVRYLPEVLCDYGHADDAMRIVKNPTAPSWLAMLSTGATAMTESWYGEDDPDKSLSMSHFSLGSVGGWFFEYLGGIRVNDCAPGFEEVVLEPFMFPEVGKFSARYDTGRGVIRTEWKYADGKAEFSYSVPEWVKSVRVVTHDESCRCH